METQNRKKKTWQHAFWVGLCWCCLCGCTSGGGRDDLGAGWAKVLVGAPVIGAEALVSTGASVVLLPVAGVMKLIDLPNELLRKKIRTAENTKTPVETLAELAEDDEWVVRTYIASNPSTPLTILSKLSEDKEEMVRASVASNPQITPELVQKLAHDPEFHVRFNIASNSRTPPEMLNGLSDEVYALKPSDPNIPLDVMERLATCEVTTVTEGLAANPNAPASVLAKLSHGHSYEVCKLVARHPNAPPEVLRYIAMDQTVVAAQAAYGIELHDDYGMLQLDVAQNPKTPPEALTYLSKLDVKMSVDILISIKRAVALHPNTSPEVLDDLAFRLYYWREVLQNPNATPDILERLSTHEYPEIRQKVASNPKTPLEILVRLEKDSNTEVRQAAQQALQNRQMLKNR